jgi:hypothetical protein
MYNINYNYGVASVHLVDSPFPGCQPQDKQPESGWWETNLTIIPPDGAIIGAGDGRSYQVDYCRSIGKGCMRNL